jgi:hypothetical protein
MHSAATGKDAGSSRRDDMLQNWHYGTARNEMVRKWRDG